MTWCGEGKRFRDAQGSPSAARAVGCVDETTGDRRSIDAVSDAPPEDARTDEAAWLWAVTDEPDEGALWNEKTKAPTKTCENEKTALRHDEASASH